MLSSVSGVVFLEGDLDFELEDFDFVVFLVFLVVFFEVLVFDVVFLAITNHLPILVLIAVFPWSNLH